MLRGRDEPDVPCIETGMLRRDTLLQDFGYGAITLISLDEESKIRVHPLTPPTRSSPRKR